MRIGIEVGGTFTDLVALDGARGSVAKVPSTPISPDIGAFNALEAGGISPASITDLVHGSTIATNAILERRGAKIAFVTTRGFRDILFLQRHDRRSIYDLRYAKPAPPVRRRDCFEVTERVDARGEVIRPLDTGEVRRDLLPALAAGGYEAVALCLLSSYASPIHEAELAGLITEALPHMRVAASHVIAPEFREFERASTTVLSAYVQPVIDGYLDRFENRLKSGAFAGRFSVMQSNGGRLPAAAMRRNAISALFSGPAAGLVGAIRQAARSARGDLITFDMGGTSTDVSLVRGGEPALAPETEIDGLPIRTPVLDIVSVGAGGGSLVWIDDGGMLRVGPRSAGAEPGPACYGRGGTSPTITDAHVVRGTIRPESFLGGSMKLDAEAARRSFRDVAAKLGTDVNGAAVAAIRLGVANIVRAIQIVSTERGRDPRDYALLPFGGAGPLLAAEIANELGIGEILVPPNPGVISAQGLLAADYVKVYGATRRLQLDNAAPDALREAHAHFRGLAEKEFRELGLGGPLEFELEVDMRFVGQAFEIPVAIADARLAALTSAALHDAFVEAHRRVYLHGGEPGRRAEIVSLRLLVRRRLDDLPNLRERAVDMDRPRRTPINLSDGDTKDAAIVDAAGLGEGRKVAGPALIEGYSSTIWVPEGWVAARDAAGNLLMRKEGS
jgi:N-methylhydantoinase A